MEQTKIRVTIESDVYRIVAYKGLHEIGTVSILRGEFGFLVYYKDGNGHGIQRGLRFDEDGSKILATQMERYGIDTRKICESLAVFEADAKYLMMDLKQVE